MDCSDGAVVTVGHGNDVGQIELALGILVVQTRQPAAQLAAVGHQHASVHLADGELLGVGILLLDDADHLAIVAHDAAIAGRVVQHHG